MLVETIRRMTPLVALASAALLACGPAAAQPAAAPVSAAAAASAPAHTYAIVSLIGDEFVVVARRMEPSTNLNPNERTPVPRSPTRCLTASPRPRSSSACWRPSPARRCCAR